MKFTIAIVALATLAIAGPPEKEYKEPHKPEGPKEPKGRECKPGTYRCIPYGNGWEVCNTEGKYVFAGECPPKTVCKFYIPSMSPYCVPPKFEFP